MTYDNTCKYVAAQNPASFVRWLLPGAAASYVQILKTELPADPIRADSIILLRVDDAILHLEFERLPYSEPPMPFRMLNYWVRLYGKYHSKIEQVVIFLKPTESPLVYVDRFEAANTLHRYRVIRLWEQESAAFLADPALLPLAPLTRTDSPRDLLAQVAAHVDRIENPVKREEIAVCTSILAGLRYDIDVIKQLFSEDLMEESVFYQAIINKGVQKGLQQGLEEGLQQGQQQQAISLTLRQLWRRIGPIAPTFEAQIRKLSLFQLEELSEALLDFSSPDDLAAWLSQLN